MSLSWRDIRDLYLEACNREPRAEQEWEIHLTEGYRQVTSQLDVPELRQPEAYFLIEETTPGSGVWDDFFDLNDEIDIYAISSIFNSTDGILMHPEPSGFAGRSQYLEPTGDATTRPTPPSGTPQYWVRSGQRIYIRDRPTRTTRCEIHFHIQAPQVTEADLANHPLTPQQYDRPIVQAAAESFYLLHPGSNKPADEGSPLPSMFFGEGSRASMAARKDPRAIEDHTKRESIRLRGRSTMPRSRR